MALRNRIGLLFASWVAIEVVAFMAVVDLIGLSGAILLGIVTSLVGGSLLRRAGTSALRQLRRQAGPGGARFAQADIGLDGTLVAIGALLLLMPGFLTDAIGLLLALAIPRAWVKSWIQKRGSPLGTPPPRHGPAVIDLAPEDWRPLKD